MAMKPNIELHIEELVLHGFAPNERWSIADAVRAELEARLAAEGLPEIRESTVGRVDGGLADRGSRAIGSALYESIGAKDASASRRR